MRRWWFWLIVGSMLAAAPLPAERREVLIATVAEGIGPGTAEFIEDAVKEAERSHSVALIIQLDTPGGLAESMRKIVQAIYASSVPVVVYVSPQGARAASAGVMITMAADIAAMAPGTNIGAAHPVSAEGKDIESAMNEKVVNDMVAFSQGIAQRRGRNVEWIEKAIRNSVSITAEQALEQKVIDLIAENSDELLRKLDGREIAGKGKLALAGAARVTFEETLRIKVLKTISNPNIVYLLFMLGLAGLYFELANPGAIFPGVIGAMALILAFFAFQALPVNTTGILLILLSVFFFILELKVTSHGLLSVAGLLSLSLGSLMLFKGADPQFQIALRVIVLTVTAVTAFFVGVAAVVIRAHRRRPLTGGEALVGEVGVVRQVQGNQGKILVHGELWNVRFEQPAAVGTPVKVLEVRNLVLKVTPVAE